jgi:hypothetical protein
VLPLSFLLANILENLFPGEDQVPRLEPGWLAIQQVEYLPKKSHPQVEFLGI